MRGGGGLAGQPPLPHLWREKPGPHHHHHHFSYHLWGVLPAWPPGLLEEERLLLLLELCLSRGAAGAWRRTEKTTGCWEVSRNLKTTVEGALKTE